MSDGSANSLLPEHPELREFALAMESAGLSGDIVDARWRTVFISSELARLAGVSPQDVSRYYGESMIRRHHGHPETWGVTEQSGVTWWRTWLHVMRTTGLGGLRTVYLKVLSGDIDPARGHIIELLGHGAQRRSSP
jgi:hypothetical protein